MKLKLQAIVNFLSKVSTQLNIFILSIILVRYLDKSAYGTYLQFQLVVNMCIYTLTMGLPHSIYYFLPKAKNPRRYIFFIFLALVLVGTSVASFLIINNGFLGNLFNNEVLSSFSVYIGIAVFCLLPFGLIESFLVTVGRNNLYATINAVISVIFFLSVLVPLNFNLGLQAVFFNITCLYIAQFCVLIYVLIKYSKDIPIGKNQPRERITFKKVFKFSFPISLSVFIGKAAREIDRYIISVKFLPSQYAVYSRGAIHIPFIEILPYSTASVLMPKYTEYYDAGNFDRVLELWNESIRKISLIVYPCFAFLWLFATEIIIILYTEQYSNSVPIFRIYLFSLIVKLAVYDSLIRVSGKTKYLSYLAIISLVTNTIASLILLGFMGVRGPAIATIIVIISGVFIQLSITRSIFMTSWAKVYPWKFLAKTMSISILSISPIFFIKSHFGKINILEMGIIFLAYLTIYCIMALGFKLVSLSEIREFAKLLPFKKRKK